jgi:hypothetical protein
MKKMKNNFIGVLFIASRKVPLSIYVKHILNQGRNLLELIFKKFILIAPQPILKFK